MFADVIRYATDDKSNHAVHGALFMLKNKNGIQVFTKNGASNSDNYQIMYQHDMLNEYNGTNGKADYGKARGITRTKPRTTKIPGSEETITTEVKVDDKPYYRPK